MAVKKSARRSDAAKVSLLVVIGLIALKVTVGIISGSLSILAQAADSSLDLIAVVITFFTVRAAVKPADHEHPFGHGKLENIGAMAQGLLLVFAAGSIIFSAINRINEGATIGYSETAIGVMAVSIIASIFLSRYLHRIAEEEDSAVLDANAHNIAFDFYSAAAVMVGLTIMRLTGLVVIDSILAILVALFILRVAYGIFRNSFGVLIDVRLPEDEENIIRNAIAEHGGKELVGFHRLRTRKAGNERYVDVHVVVPSKAHVVDAHHLADHLEQDISSKLSRASVVIHVEPCDGKCQPCPIPRKVCKEKYPD
ncbi:MAG: cation diffusion facilitator family transporter [Dehalococcoidales bacterium]|nr:cation diffusion facilitator family transporter [Dehalococcoidales bacterium]